MTTSSHDVHRPTANTATLTQGSASAAACHGPRLSLVAYHREGASVASLRQGQRVVVGRTPPASLVVPDESLSRQHASFALLGEEVVVEDLGSTNGTWRDGRVVRSEVIQPGDVVVLGSVRLVVQALGGRPRLGLKGHDAFLVQLAAEQRRCRHFGRPMALVMVRSPDRGVALHEWAQDVSSALRDVDQVALYGGDTLEILLPETNEADARGLAERVARAVTSTSLRIGVAAFPHAGTSVDRLVDAAHRALRDTRLSEPIVAAPSVVVAEPKAPSTGVVVAQSPTMRSLLGLAKRVARGHIPVLLHGETGTGKEVVAHYIHEQGPRRSARLVAVNCAAIPSQLVESTLFGHMKGAFTGANSSRAGVFEAAQGGTVLLDEIGELPAAAQAALLRVLESKRVMRVGSTTETAIDVRIIAASHRDLESMVSDGSFREDLLYRLNAVTLELPPLRDRRADILPLAEHFLSAAVENHGTSQVSMDDTARELLQSYAWPGNIRELRNTMERAVVIAEHEIVGAADLPARVQAAPAEAPAPTTPPRAMRPMALRDDDETFRECLERLETQVLVEALEQAGGNQTETARRLAMPRRTLVHKIKVLGIKRDDYVSA